MNVNFLPLYSYLIVFVSKKKLILHRIVNLGYIMKL